MSNSALLLESLQRIEAIKKKADAEVKNEYHALVKTFQELHGVNEAEAQYLIYQANIELDKASS